MVCPSAQCESPIDQGQLVSIVKLAENGKNLLSKYYRFTIRTIETYVRCPGNDCEYIVDVPNE